MASGSFESTSQETTPHENYDHVFKVKLLGEDRVGKTSLARRFANHSSPPDDKATKKVSFYTRILHTNDKCVKVVIWDTTHETAFAANTFFLTDAFVLLYDSTDAQTFRKLPDWINRLEKVRPQHSQVFIVSTKNDFEDNQKVSFQEISTFSKKYNLPMFETSTLISTSMEETLMSIVDSLLQAPVVESRQTSGFLRGLCSLLFRCHCGK